MNNRERVLATLTHQQPDRIPYNIAFTQKSYARMIEFYGARDFAANLGNCLTVLGCEPAQAWREAEPDIWEDQFGVRWDRSIDKDIGNVCNCLVTPDTLDDYRFPDPDDPSRYAAYSSILKQQGERYFVANLGFSLFERAWTLAGMEQLMMAMVADKPFVNDLLDRIVDFNLKVIEKVCSYDIDAMLLGDDWGMQKGLLMGPKLWEEFIRPRIARMYERIRSSGKLVFIHCCGKVDELLPDLIECGVDVFNPFQPEVMDIFAIKEKYGERLSFFGGISTQKTLPYGSIDEVKEEVRRLLEEIGKDGGYIAAPAHAIPGDAKPENVHAMIEVLQGQ